ncbi:urea ABC transporter permease subunit UrtB [Photobacterium sp. SDRW27]|uniref:urea ABC transporter permease subunit UrtB n=1 Tax=Photobacterium obscurum TaxID=2829490 RepID=UPI00224445EE|nr:urea ABC transporter permease subunit UrtB [Photobacterium obscurum]MCW8330194.1 urea ABC transporter permease subunit UrtB [Photobacterium obscurum]
MNRNWWRAPKKVAQLLKSILAAWLGLVLLIFPAASSYADTGTISTFADVERHLSQRNFNNKQQAIEWLIESRPPYTRQILTGLLDGQVFYQRQTKRLYLISELAAGQPAQSVESNDVTMIESKRNYKKVGLNNRLRTAIRLGIAQLDLEAESESLRLQAAKGLVGNTDHSVQALLNKTYQTETSAEVKNVVALALAIANIQAPDEEVRQAAIEQLSGSLEPAAFRALSQALDLEMAKEDGDAVLILQLERTINAYQQSQRFYDVAETLYFGLSLGSVLVLAGIGLAITFGVMGVINMAHGELIMLGAYTTYVMQQLLPNNIGLSLVLSIPAAFIVSGLVGVAIERGVIRFLYGRPLETLLATFGISLILQQAVRSIFSPLNRSVATPDWMSGMLEINPMLSLTYNRLYIIFFCLFVFAALVFVIRKTPLGLQVRAVSQNRAMARAMGVRSEWVDAMTFGLGSGVAGVAGVALSQLTNVGPNMGQSYIIDSFMVVVFGGVGNLWGTLVAGLSLGVFNKILEPWAGAVLAKILVLIFIILFIQKRPRGLFPQRGRAVEG